MQLIIGALKFAEFPDHILIDYVYTNIIRLPSLSMSDIELSTVISIIQSVFVKPLDYF